MANGSSKFNVASVILALLVAHFIPFELIIFSYVILGPLHYLTQISWLHDRSYFEKNKYLPMLMVLGVCGLIFKLEYIGGYLYSCLLLSLALGFSGDRRWGVAVLTAGAALYWIVASQEAFIVLVSVLLPTIIHVMFFTLFFVIHGYRKRKATEDRLILMFYFLAIVSFFLVGSSSPTLYPEWTAPLMPAFILITLAMKSLSFQTVDANTTIILPLMKVVAFAYTYHYLNWFSKTDVLGWHRISSKRLLVIVSGYLFSLGIYYYDPLLGYRVLFYLSVLHVTLEFPLNIKVIKSTLSLKE